MPELDAGVIGALRAFGASPESLETASALVDNAAFEVYEENWEAVKVFLAASTQWRVVGLGGFGHALVHTGLDYVALEVIMRMQCIPRSRRAAVFDQVRVLEEGALDALHSV
ncbi:DUF1799 domain-containing protein [Burkholderia gladioli]|uniref:Uncharacterized protein n=1 Tax=Burkholderia gladioli (strain BSR3) TaxID=999541 RepID=F2L9L2_BURGS|nr:DUF1799 domain-containing protein [Burkholderia gladioli]AEA59775.1 hypothetical protein bgla_1g10920 [Burkholderia gladioli BSR3]